MTRLTAERIREYNASYEKAIHTIEAVDQERGHAWRRANRRDDEPEAPSAGVRAV